ncbi:uncharacterized protein LOC110893564 [Helianthus annuus]|uniref:uncharacterized protein LOC110893564 n=1 Tax=Helianthus annuus TaxID=4232 RepID=UPI000B8FD319|nr:uncharacterized protein LOC110893564 [Helianthus annuus]
MIDKEELPIHKKEDWFVKLTATPNRVFNENVIVAARMSDQWPTDSKEVSVFKFQGREARLYQAAFPTFGGSMGVRPLEAGEQYWYEEIRRHFMYPIAGAFADPPSATEGAHIPNPRPLRAITSAGKEILYLSSEESVGSSNGELSSWSNVFAGVLRNLGIDPEEKKKKPNKRKKVITLDAEVTSKKGGSSRATASAADKGEKSAAGSKSSGSAVSRNPDAGATPSSIALDEEEEEEEEEEHAEKLISRKRSREETTAGASVAQKAGEGLVIGKQSNLRSLYKFSPEAKKKTPEKKCVMIKDPQEPAPKKTKKKKAAEKPVDKVAEKEKEREKKKASEKPVDDPKETGAAATTAHEKAQGPAVVHITGLDQPLHEKRKEPEVEKLTKPTQADAPVQTVQVTSTTGGSGSAIPKEKSAKAGSASSGGAGGSVPQSPIGPNDTVGVIYYKTYTEARGDAPHRAPWGLKQKDTFLEFAPCRDWFLNSFPPGEVNRQRARTHESLYHAYVVGEANTCATNHQIVREWRTMVKERAEWEKYCERLLKQVKEYEKAKAAFAKEKAKFDSDKKSEEWGREALRGKLRATEDLLAKERAEWKKICEKDNQRMYAARSKITDLEAQVTELKGKIEDERTNKERVEAELKAQVSSKDKDLAAKDIEIAELKRHLQEQTDKSESLEIDLEAERGKAATSEEARQKAEEA